LASGTIEVSAGAGCSGRAEPISVDDDAVTNIAASLEALDRLGSKLRWWKPPA
jgi:hypothetical protein